MTPPRRPKLLHPDPIIFVEHASDLTLEANYETHQGMTDESFLHLEPWDVVQLCDEPERARRRAVSSGRGNRHMVRMDPSRSWWARTGSCSASTPAS